MEKKLNDTFHEFVTPYIVSDEIKKEDKIIENIPHPEYYY